MVTDASILVMCILHDGVNNMQERKQSPLVVVNSTYPSNRLNVVVLQTHEYRFYLMDKDGNYSHRLSYSSVDLIP